VSELTGLDLVDAIAKETLGWHDRGGWWWRAGSPTGFRVAYERLNYPDEGFFRPDRNLFHLQFCEFMVWRLTGAEARAEFPGKNLRKVIEGGGLQTTVVDENTLDDFNNEIGALAVYLFVKAWREEHDG